jgi:hypothetical protein
MPGQLVWLGDRLPRVREVGTASELKAFAAGYEAVSGYRVAQDYLARAHVFVIICKGRMAGGFVLNDEPPFRTQARLPETDQRRLKWAFPPGDTVEMTCVWLEPRLRGTLAATALWANFVWRAGRLGPNVVFGTEVDKLRLLYEQTRPQLVYDGTVCVDGQLKHGWVYRKAVTRFPVATLIRLNIGRWAR